MKAHIPGIGNACQIGELHASSLDGTAAIIIGGAKLYLGPGQWHKAEECPRAPKAMKAESVPGTPMPGYAAFGTAPEPDIVLAEPFQPEPEPPQEPKQERRKPKMGKHR